MLRLADLSDDPPVFITVRTKTKEGAVSSDSNVTRVPRNQNAAPPPPPPPPTQIGNQSIIPVVDPSRLPLVDMTSSYPSYQQQQTLTNCKFLRKSDWKFEFPTKNYPRTTKKFRKNYDTPLLRQRVLFSGCGKFKFSSFSSLNNWFLIRNLCRKRENWEFFRVGNSNWIFSHYFFPKNLDIYFSKHHMTHFYIKYNFFSTKMPKKCQKTVKNLNFWFSRQTLNNTQLCSSGVSLFFAPNA